MLYFAAFPVSTSSPIDILFGGMEKLGPGGNEHTLHVLRLLPQRQFNVIVDAGCGTGRQTMVLARELRRLVHAVDSHEPFLAELTRRAKEAGIGDIIQSHCRDMNDIPQLFPKIDLLWSEGAAYNIGFVHALRSWASAINPEGFAVISELSWLHERVPTAVREYFASGYPDMQSVRYNIEAAENAGYAVVHTYALPTGAWVEGYYDVLASRAGELVNHPDASVRNLAAGTIKEIEIFDRSEGSYGYVFYVLQRTNTFSGPSGWRHRSRDAS